MSRGARSRSPVSTGCCYRAAPLNISLPLSAQGDASTAHGSSTSAQLSKCSFSSANAVFLPCFLYSKYLGCWCLRRITEMAIRQPLISRQLPLHSTGIIRIPAGSFSQESRTFAVHRTSGADARGVAGGDSACQGCQHPASPLCHAVPCHGAAGGHWQQRGSPARHSKWSGWSHGTVGFPHHLIPLLSARTNTHFWLDQPRLPVPPTGTWTGTQKQSIWGRVSHCMEFLAKLFSPGQG